MDRLKLATAWLGGCAGCHMSFLDLDEYLLELAAVADVVYSPLVDRKEYPEGVDVCLIEGAVGNEDNRALLQRIRARTRVLVAFGDCAITGNVPALRNQFGPGNAAAVLQCAYAGEAGEYGRPPVPGDLLPALLPQVRPVHAYVRVEYFLPGCPPPAARIRRVLADLLAGTPPILPPDELKFG